MKLEVNSGALPRVAAPDAKTLVNGKPERMAWIVLFGAFFACIALTLLVPLFGFQFVRYSTVPVNALLQAAPLRADQVAPVRVTLPNVTLPLAVIDPATITENSRVETDTTDNSRAFMTFFDNSTATIYKNSQIVLSEMRQPQFGVSEQPNSIVIEQSRGIVRYGVASPLSFSENSSARPTRFLVRTPHFDVWLNPGSYSLDVTDNVSQVSVREGSAAIRSRDGSRELLVGQGQRVIAERSKPLADPIPAAQELIVNGEFTSEIDCSPNATGPWRCYSDQGGDGGVVNGSAGVVTKGDRRAVQIRRTGSEQNSAITGITQTIDRDVSDYRSLTLSADVRVEGHNLSGGGYLSTEYPLILRIRYRDIDGNEREYVRGFYSQNDTNNPTANGELLPQGQWIPIDSSNLLASLPIKPFHILSLEIYASGWDYESYVSNVRLKAE
ncbi:MAG: hypothetical protein IT331_05975 [Anaerolineae bacterium]|nr:hypothetical protein [Anaerolineae bacterium]